MQYSTQQESKIREVLGQFKQGKLKDHYNENKLVSNKHIALALALNAAEIKKPIKMTLPDFIQEHVKLVNTLLSGNKEDLKQEAKEQTSELKEKLQKSFDSLAVNQFVEDNKSNTTLEKSFNVLGKQDSIEIIKSFGEEDLTFEKAMDTSKLIKKKVQIHSSNGKVYEGYRWVHAGSEMPVANESKQKEDVKDEKNPIKQHLNENGHKNIDKVHAELKDKFKLTDEEAKKHIDTHVNENLKKHGFLSEKGEIQLKNITQPALKLQLEDNYKIADLVKDQGKEKVENEVVDNINSLLGNKTETELKNKPVYQLQEELKSKELQKVLKANKEARAKKLGITGKDKFDAYRFKLDQLIGDKMTRSALIYGTGGLGKTFNAEEKLREYGKVGWDPELDLNHDEYDYRKVTGNTSPTDLYNILYENKDKLVLFDDADSMWEGGNEEMRNLLKGVLDSTGDRMVHYGNPKAMADGTKAPTDFKFNGQILFISNLQRNKFPQPIVDSRANALDLSMDMDQTLDMLTDIKDKFKYKDAKGEEIKISKEDRNDILKVLNELKNDLRVEQVNGRTLGNLAALKASLAKKGEKDYDTFKRQAMISLDLV